MITNKTKKYSTADLKKQLLQYCSLLCEKELVGGTQGNYSVRKDADSIIITPSGKSLRQLKPADLVVVSMKAQKLSGKFRPSSELKLHLGIYEQRSDIQSVCHAHPAYATAFSIQSKKLTDFILPEIVNTFGTIPLVGYRAPGTPELFKELERYIKHHDAFLLERHGVVTCGTDIEAAFNKMETVERYARILYITNWLGDLTPLPKQLAVKLEGYKNASNQLRHAKNDIRKLSI